MDVINETDTEDQLTPAEMVQTAKPTIKNFLPLKSIKKYTTAYNKFIEWKTENKLKSFSENTLLSYLKVMSHIQKPTTLWSTYWMLRTTLSMNNNINIKNYPKLKPFLKRKSQGYQSEISKVLTAEQIKKFLNEAPDGKYLDTKVAMIFGICGACTRKELTQITINDIEDKESILLVKIPKIKNYKSRSFVITNEFYSIFKKYINLRPKDVLTSRFFLNYHNGQCTKQPIGINKIGRMPRIIASYLKLPDSQLYTGHTFRCTSETLLANSGADIITLKRHDGLKSSTVVEEYIDDSSNNKKICNRITHSIINKPSSSQDSETNFNYKNSSTSKDSWAIENLSHMDYNTPFHLSLLSTNKCKQEEDGEIVEIPNETEVTNESCGLNSNNKNESQDFGHFVEIRGEPEEDEEMIEMPNEEEISNESCDSNSKNKDQLRDFGNFVEIKGEPEDEMVEEEMVEIPTEEELSNKSCSSSSKNKYESQIPVNSVSIKAEPEDKEIIEIPNEEEVTNESCESNSTNRNESQDFGNFVATKLKRYDKLTQSIIQKEIMTIFLDADRSFYKQTRSSYQSNYNPNNRAQPQDTNLNKS